MRVSNQLKELAKIFSKKATLYIVGGYVRNAILGLEHGDLDITSALTPEEVELLLEDSKFEIISSYKRFGTLVIKGEEEEFYEYTCFRKDSYRVNSGSHIPVSVAFVKTLEEDALRRDFKINAIYFDVLKGNFIDPLGGLKDLSLDLISTTKNPEKVFDEDALRILRLVRQASELNLKIEEKTLKAASKKSILLSNIHAERKASELNKIVKADVKYPQLKAIDAHYKGVKTLIEIGAMQYLLPSLLKCEGVKLNKESKKDILEHSLERFKHSSVEVRYAALLQDVGKPIALKERKNTFGSEKIGEALIHQDLGEGGLNFPSKVISTISKLLRIHDFNFNGLAKENTIKKFIIKNTAVISMFFDLREAEFKARGEEPGEKNFWNIKKIYESMIEEKVPFNLSNLEVNGHDCMEIGIKEKEIGMALRELLWESVLNPVLRNRESQKKFLIKWHARRTSNNE